MQTNPGKTILEELARNLQVLARKLQHNQEFARLRYLQDFTFTILARKDFSCKTNSNSCKKIIFLQDNYFLARKNNFLQDKYFLKLKILFFARSLYKYDMYNFNLARQILFLGIKILL